jgi:hypothetical protein
MAPKISKIYYIVHPFYGERESEESAKMDLDYWKSLVDRVSGDKSAILITEIFKIRHYPEAKALAEYAMSKLGDRFSGIEQPFPIQDKRARKEIRNIFGKLEFSNSLKMFACGENIDACLKYFPASLAETFKIRKRNIYIMPDLSRADKLHEMGDILKEKELALHGTPFKKASIRYPMNEKELGILSVRRGFSVIPREKIKERQRRFAVK